ncbi:hypothetical protein EJ02DRAFT_423041 [Clathrospora elynae]|uniref:Uncharacterized protein n=1 Tax=Clathrospora elynae TaxID=706981 RepID=A0A6A5SLE5_9PLEO|nr:hypothetical protein EJ02DRAFT_423041 [Clathrospora elynae]
MASYGSVPSEEYEPDAHTATQHADGLTTPNPNQTAQTYVQVPKDEDVHPQRPGHRFADLCVSRIVLLGLAFFFASSALTIGLLYHFSLVHNGLTTESSSHRYAWLYGPTAVVVLLRVIWRVIDLKVKETMPWHELAHGPSPAERTILLEYLSSSPLPNIWKSLRFRHWAATITATGQLILLLMLVFITGLFTLEATLIKKADVPFRGNDLNASAFNISNFDASPALLTLAIQTQNLSYPKGTSLDTLVPYFAAGPEYPANLTTQALVKGLKVSIDCEHLDIKNASQTFLP